MTSFTTRRPLSGSREAQLPHDENAKPVTPRSGLLASASPASNTRVAGSLSKLPSLSDIAARLNRDKDLLTPTASPVKPPLSSNSSDLARPRLELTVRFTGSPRSLPSEERTGPMLSLSPLKASTCVATFDDSLDGSASPKAPSSRACSPTKRMLASGLPSLDEIRERMTRKGLATSSEYANPKDLPTPSSPGKPAGCEDSIRSTDAIQSPTATPGSPPLVAYTNMLVKPSLQLPTTSSLLVTPKLKHPLPPSPIRPSTYPLQHEWTLFYDIRAVGPSTPGSASISEAPSTPLTPILSSSSWEANLRTIGTHSAVETFLNCFVHLRRPSQLDRHSSYHVFKDGIKPMWEDARNAKGGKWTITFRLRNPALIDRSWLWLVLGLIGEQLDEADETCGAVCSVRPRGDRIALWVKDGSDVEKLNRIGRKLISLLELEKEPGILMEFSAHERAEEGKLEGLFSLQNAMQALPFGVQAGQVSQSPPGIAALSGNASRPAFKKAFSSSPDVTSYAATEPKARLNGQQSSASASGLACSPPTAGSSFGALGQSLGLGISGNTSTNLTPRPSSATKPDKPSSFSAPQCSSGSAFNWRTSMDRSVSPRRRDTAHVATTARSPSPFKAS
ncbi:Translation Initiation factor eIF- 4e [Kalmanozyma brasiliensis GHG001]|uniref:Translation Initiation factor eIF- 4e n=1 Tax=Kalmanozyma brasiliensis (strain GHG001) TaxID=1365824 RepID=UPI002867DEF2|nr:Translation Initiation factor eIF- 4e [Kalmanozyma brasiliensis GHG001]KAF6767539.1 Translation Initiation factor eIF- 4e [Kalmanozyma brasiliensis GHG001]